MANLLLQLTTWDRVQVIRQEFNRDCGVEDLIVPIAGLCVVAGLVVVLSRMQQNRRRADVDRPGKLFKRMLERLGLSRAQRGLLRRMAARRYPANPTVVLVGRRIFDRHAQRWLVDRPNDAHRVRELGRRLFPGGYGTATSATASRPATPESPS